MLNNSTALFERAKKIIPGGVNSPVRAFQAVGGQPRFLKSGQGPYVYDVDGNRYVDYVGSWGPLILGHNHPNVVKAIEDALKNGLSFGAPTEKEIELAEQISEIMPSIEMIRMVNSGTEATLSAIRLARGYTNKYKIIKFDGCYHGHSDSLLVKAGSGALSLGIPGSAGVPPELAQHTLIAPFNDLDATKNLFAQHKDDIAAIIVEPIAGNMNLVLPQDGFLAGLRELCDTHNSLLIFDEVITGFRVALGGAQAIYNVIPDITCLGKIVGGGMPVGAFGGKRQILSQLAPLGPVYQAGTLSGNPIAMSAGIATIQELKKPNVYAQLQKLSNMLTKGMLTIAKKHNISISANCIGGLFGFSFQNDPQQETFKTFFHSMLNAGFYIAPSAFEAGFVSLAHTENIIKQTLDAIDNTYANL